MAVAGLGEFQVQCILYDLNFESRCSQSKISSDKNHQKKNQKKKNPQKKFKKGKTFPTSRKGSDITHKESSQTLDSDLKKNKQKPHQNTEVSQMSIKRYFWLITKLTG